MVHSIAFVVAEGARYRADQHAETCHALGHQVFVATSARETPAGTVAISYPLPPDAGLDEAHGMIEPDVVVLVGQPAVMALDVDVIANARREGQTIVADVDRREWLTGRANARLSTCAGVIVATVALAQHVTDCGVRQVWVAATAIDPGGEPARAAWWSILATLDERGNDAGRPGRSPAGPHTDEGEP